MGHCGPLWDNVKVHGRTYLRENKRSSFVHVAAAMGGDGDDEIEQEGTARVEEMNNHDIDLPGDDDDE